jgi:spore maturation protein SpmA
MFGSGCATITGLIAVKLMQRMKIFNKDVAEDSRK